MVLKLISYLKKFFCLLQVPKCSFDSVDMSVFIFGAEKWENELILCPWDSVQG